MIVFHLGVFSSPVSNFDSLKACWKDGEWFWSRFGFVCVKEVVTPPMDGIISGWNQESLSVFHHDLLPDLWKTLLSSSIIHNIRSAIWLLYMLLLVLLDNKST